MTAASPGIITLTMKNDHYATYEDYVFAVAEEMRKEYELIVSKGLILQLDCPDLAMERHVSYQDEPLEAFQEVVELHIEAINRALREHTPRAGAAARLLGQQRGPAPSTTCRLQDILPIIYRANVGALVMEMANPRHAHEYKVYRRAATARRHAAGGGRHRHQDQLRGTPRGGGRGGGDPTRRLRRLACRQAQAGGEGADAL